MKSGSDRVSFIVPAYNASDFVRPSGDSHCGTVASITDGNLEDGDEIIVVNERLHR